MNLINQENDENLAFPQFFHFYPILDYYDIRSRTNFKSPNGESLYLHLIM